MLTLKILFTERNMHIFECMFLFYILIKRIKDIESKTTKKREKPQKKTKIKIEQKQKMIYNSLSKERENANNKTNRRSI